MPASIVTNWGKASFAASFVNNTDADGGAVAATMYLILIDSTYPGWAGSSDPDTENTSAVTGAINPVAGGAGYTGNSVARGAFTIQKDLVNDRSLITFTSNPTITAGATAINNVRGFALCTANSVASGKVICFVRFDQNYSIGANQQATITNAGILGT